MIEGKFTSEDPFDIPGRMKAMEQLRALDCVWIGPDVSLEKKVTIPPLGFVQNVNIVVNKSDFPQIDISRGALGSLEWSVRSCLAQSGAEIRFFRGDVSKEMIQDINAGKNVPIPIHVSNNVDRPIELEGKVMRFFYVNFAKKLEQGKLREIIGKELIIEGEQGKDWSFGDVVIENDIPGVSMAEGIDPEKLKDICIKLPLTNKFYIPPAAEPLRVRSKQDLPNVLQEIPPGLEPVFKVGETTKIRLGNNLTAVIMTSSYEKGKKHGFLSLIDGGFEGNIRTETLYGLEFIELFVYRK
jgi:hypothetical protein